MVAKFYQVELNTIQQIIKRHQNKRKEDGDKFLKKKDLGNEHHVYFEYEEKQNNQYNSLADKGLENVHNVHLEIPNRGFAVFP